jgi:hypothetical protein
MNVKYPEIYAILVFERGHGTRVFKTADTRKIASEAVDWLKRQGLDKQWSRRGVRVWIRKYEPAQ